MGLTTSAGYNALRESAAWLDVSPRTKILIQGPDAARLLHALTTNHIQELEPGQGCYAFFLDAQGHILADATILRRRQDFWLDAEPEVRNFLLDHLDRYIIADDVTPEDVTDRWAAIAVEGPRAAEVLATLGAPAPARPWAHADWDGAPVARLDLSGVQGYVAYIPPKRRETLIRELEQAGAVAASPEDARIVRIEQGKPRYGEDVSERHLPQETQALYAVHFSKGCYLGQEIVERLRSRGRIKRMLVRLEIETQVPPPPGTTCGGGQITSAVFSPASGKVVALAYVEASLAAPHTVLEVAGFPARVLPPYQPGA